MTKNRAEKAVASLDRNATTRRRWTSKLPVAGVVLVVVIAATASAAWAVGGTSLCFQEKEGGAIKQTKDGACPKGYRLMDVGGTSFSPEEEATLKNVLPHIRYLESGVGGKPTIQFSGVNVQVVNGEGVTASTNGEGNIVIGYDETRNLYGHAASQTGSHNLVLGEGSEYTSFGAIVAGLSNSVTAPFGSATGGAYNTVSGEYAEISGGDFGTASGLGASVSGGGRNLASGEGASVTSGVGNQADGEFTAITGGESNTASNQRSSVSGGTNNAATGYGASVSGGTNNRATAQWAWTGGGLENFAEGKFSAIYGGAHLRATKEYEAK